MPKSSYMSKSVIPDDWLLNALAQVPPGKPIMNAAGQPAGTMLTGPVRLAFTNSLFTPQKQDSDDGGESKSKFSVVALFPPPSICNLTTLWQAWRARSVQDFPQHVDSAGNPAGLYNPFRMQDERIKYDGFNAGSYFLTLGSNFKPPIVDNLQNPIVDERAAHSGCWGICSVGLYKFEYHHPKTRAVMKRGVNFGLQSVMIISSDTNLGAGGSADPSQEFKGLMLSKPIDVAGAFGVPQAAPGQSMIPPGMAPPGMLTPSIQHQAPVMALPPISGQPAMGVPPGYGSPPAMGVPPGYGAPPAYAAPAEDPATAELRRLGVL